MMSEPLLTIGISFYNNADTLHDLARTIFAQTLEDWEWIVIDDGSTDGGGEFVRRIDDPRVRFISDGVNRGRPTRYNQITEMARGRFIARMDADDMCDPLKFEKQARFLSEHANIDVVSSDMLKLSTRDEPVGRTYNPPEHDDICADPLNKFRICHGAMMARKTFWQKHPYPTSERVAEDYGMFLSSYRHARFANISEPLYYYREYFSHSLRKYYQTNTAVARFISTYGPQSFSRGRILLSRCSRYGRIGVYVLATLTGQHERLLAMRTRQPAVAGTGGGSLSNNDIRMFTEALSVIRQTAVPGIDP